jgi:hypothetical protein
MAAPWRHPKTGVFYFRRAVPERLRAGLGKREIKVSLGTKDLAEAKRRFAAEAARCEALFAKAAAGRMTPERAREVAAAWRDRIREDDGWNLFWDEFDAQVTDPGRPPGPLLWPEEWWQGVEAGKDPGRLAGLAGKVMSPQEIEQLGDGQQRRLIGRELAAVARDHRHNFAPATAAHEAAVRAEQQKANMTISQLHALWIDECQSGPSTLKDWTKAKQRFVEIFGDVRVKEISRAHAQRFREILRKTPKNPKKEIARLPILQQIERVAGTDHPVIKAGTINKHLLWLKRMMNLAVDNGIIESNPAERVSQRDPEPARDKRHPYTAEDLNTIFGSVLFGGAPPQGAIKHPSLLKFEHARWLPLLGLFQGARLNELGQCLKADVGHELGIDYIAITTIDAEEQGAAPGDKKSVKTMNAVRRIPLHPVLLELGFLDYVKNLKSRYLFPHLNHTSNQSPTGKFSSYWGPFTRSLGVASTKKSFHSFRHCYRNQADMMPELVRLTLMGRSWGDVYGSPPDLPELKKWNDRIEYPGLDLDPVRAHFRNKKR